jgi:hypothetical protein
MIYCKSLSQIRRNFNNLLFKTLKGTFKLLTSSMFLLKLVRILKSETIRVLMGQKVKFSGHYLMCCSYKQTGL